MEYRRGMELKCILRLNEAVSENISWSGHAMQVLYLSKQTFLAMNIFYNVMYSGF